MSTEAPVAADISTPEEDSVRLCAENNAAVKAFRERPSVTSSRSILKLESDHRTNSVTQGTLTGPGLLNPSPLVFVDNENGSLQIIHHVGHRLAGQQGLLHGGVASMLLDEAMGRACFPLLPDGVGVTVEMTLSYKAPVPAGSIILIQAKTVRVEGRKAWTEGTIENPETGIVCVKASALFVQPREARAMSKVW